MRSAASVQVRRVRCVCVRLKVQFPGVHRWLDAVNNASADEEKQGKHCQQASVAEQDKRIAPIDKEVKEEAVCCKEEPRENDIQATIVEHEHEVVCCDAKLIEKCLGKHEDQIQIMRCKRGDAQEASIVAICLVSKRHQHRPNQKENQACYGKHDLKKNPNRTAKDSCHSTFGANSHRIYNRGARRH